MKKKTLRIAYISRSHRFMCLAKIICCWFYVFTLFFTVTLCPCLESLFRERVCRNSSNFKGIRKRHIDYYESVCLRILCVRFTQRNGSEWVNEYYIIWWISNECRYLLYEYIFSTWNRFSTEWMNEWMLACKMRWVGEQERERKKMSPPTDRPTEKKKQKKTRNFQSLELPDIMVYWYCNPNEQCTTPNDTRMGAVRESRMVVELNRLIFTKENGKKMLYTVLLLLLLLLPLPLLFW